MTTIRMLRILLLLVCAVMTMGVNSCHPTAPPCENIGESCGSSGEGLCMGLCPEGQGGVCVRDYSSLGCIKDADCPADEDCISVRLGTDYCGGACVKPWK